MNTKIMLCVLIAMFTAGFASPLPLKGTTPYVLIVNAANPTEKLSTEELKMIYLGETTTWEYGESIKLATLKEGDLHKEFLKDITTLSPLKFSHYWKKVVFTGSGSAPQAFRTETQLLEYIRQNTSAIGYISRENLDESVKVVKIRN